MDQKIHLSLPINSNVNFARCQKMEKTDFITFGLNNLASFYQFISNLDGLFWNLYWLNYYGFYSRLGCPVINSFCFKNPKKSFTKFRFYDCSNFRVFECSVFQIFDISNFLIFRIFWIFRFFDFRMFEFSNSRFFECCPFFEFPFLWLMKHPIQDKEYGRVGQRWSESTNNQPVPESIKTEKKDFNIITNSKDGKYLNVFQNLYQKLGSDRNSSFCSKYFLNEYFSHRDRPWISGVSGRLAGTIGQYI